MRMRTLSAFLFASFYLACGPAPAQQPAEEPEGSVIPEESKEMVRQGDAQILASVKQMDEQIDKNEAEITKAMKAALGQEAPYPGGKNPAPAPQAIGDIKKAGIELSIAPVLDQNGKPVANQFVQLVDSYSKRVQEIAPKMSSGKATPAEKKFMMDGAKHVPAINDLKSQVRLVTMPAMQSGWMVTTGSMTTMNVVANMVRTRRQMEMDWTDEDYEMVRQLLERQSRRESVAGLSLAMMAAYQAVVNEGADPKLIEDVAKAGIEALPIKGTATKEQAKKYLDNFKQNVDSAQKLYEDQMRKTFGDAEYEAKYKAQIDSMFTQAKAATTALSATELMKQTGEKYKADIQKCARGEKLPPDTMVGPGACKDAKAAAGPDGTLSAADLKRLTGGAANKVEEEAQSGLMNLLDAIPGVAQVKMALEGVVALKDGDAAKALSIAGDLIPIPGVSGALKSASKAVKAVQSD